MTVRFRSRSTANWLLAGTIVLAGASRSVRADGPQSAPPAQPATPAAAAPVASSAAPAAVPPATALPAVPGGIVAPAQTIYQIGPDDVLNIVFWRDKDMSGDVIVRPDGKISLPLIGDVTAAGLTPDQLRDRLADQSKRFIEDPNVTVVVRQINSRKVFITGEVARPGPYSLSGPTTVLQLIAIAGGLRDYADVKHIIVMRTENGRAVSYPFNYRDVTSRKGARQNIELKPGDTIIVP